MCNTRKTNFKSQWRNQLKINFTDEEFEFIWGVYESIEECMKCGKTFKNSRDKCFDHDHSTGEPRYILCRTCNNREDKEVRYDSKSGIKYIVDREDRWVVDIHRNGIRKYRSCNKNKYTLNEVVEIKNKLIKKYFHNL